MTKLFIRLSAVAYSIFLLGAATIVVQADDRFALAIGEHGDLLVFAPHGEKVGDYPAPAIAQPVVISGGPSFQVSYGRDVNNQLSVILSPDPSAPHALHFTVLNKTIDADKQAVITLTFSPSLNRVKIDPGFIGSVQVNAENVQHRSTEVTSTETEAPRPRTHPMTHIGTPAMTTSGPVTTSPAPRMNMELAPRDIPPSSNNSSSTNVSKGTGSGASAASSVLEPVSTTGGSGKSRLFWAEPVSSPDGATPKVGPNEMKLLAVHGSVSVKTTDGHTEHGTSGMLVPSGSTITTAAGSSAAVLMGGVDSARLLPKSGIVVAQTMEGTVRHTTIDLEKGTVFSRVGRRPGETQKYEVRTPEGVAAARGTEYCDVRVEGAHVVFVNKGTVDLFVDGKLVGTVTGSNGSIGMNSMGKKMDQTDLRRLLNEVLTELQPYNVTTIQALFDYQNGKATPEEIALIQSELYGSVASNGNAGDPGDTTSPGAALPVGLHDLQPQITPFATPADEPTNTAQETAQ